jgi:DNA-binding response OmpR family regulator
VTPSSRIVAVSDDLQRAELLDALLAEANEYDVIFVASIERGYSRIKQVTPDLVVVFLEIEDAAGCQLLSMLKMDSEVASIPVVTCVTRHETLESDEIIADVSQNLSSHIVAIQMN